jgi:hypothetical protein
VEGRHSRLETRTRTSTRSSSHEYGDRWTEREASSTELDSYIPEHGQEGLSPILNLPRLLRYSSWKQTYPTTHSRDELNSAFPGDPGASILTSIGSTVLHQEGLYDPRCIAVAHDAWKRSSDFNIPVRSSSFICRPGNTSTTLPPLFHTMQYNDATNLSPNQPFRKSTWLPSITHEGKILSCREDPVYDRANGVGCLTLLVKHPQSSMASLQPVATSAKSRTDSVPTRSTLPSFFPKTTGSRTP